MNVSVDEADDWRWCSLEDLDDPVIPIDIRHLGKRAIQAASPKT
jgi:hypothetical protein